MNTSTPASPLPALSPAPWAVALPVPSDQGLSGEIVILGPRAERVCEPLSRVRGFFVVSGALTVTVGATNHLLATDALLALPPDRGVTLRNHSGEPVKLLSLALPEPRVERRLVFPDAASSLAQR